MMMEGQVNMTCISTILCLNVRVRNLGHESRAGVKDVKVGDKDD